MRIILVFNSKCEWATLNKVWNSGGLKLFRIKCLYSDFDQFQK